VEYRAMQEYTGTFRDTREHSGECLFMQVVQGNTGEYRGIQGNTGEYRANTGCIIRTVLKFALMAA
jgi:hypothetical protein